MLKIQHQMPTPMLTKRYYTYTRKKVDTILFPASQRLSLLEFFERILSYTLKASQIERIA